MDWSRFMGTGLNTTTKRDFFYARSSTLFFCVFVIKVATLRKFEEICAGVVKKVSA